MKSIDPVRIKQAVKDGQLIFYVKEQWNGTYIYCKDTNTKECVCVGEVKAGSEVKKMTADRQKKINEWCDIHCQKCVENLDRGTGYVNCQMQCEVQKDIGIACIHYEEYLEGSE